MSNKKEDKPKKSCTTPKVNLKLQQQGGKATERKGPKQRGQS